MILLDTHALIWAAEDNRRLGEAARATIEEARYSDRAGVSAITPWEIALLVEKGRLQLAMELGAWIRAVFQAPGIDLMAHRGGDSDRQRAAAGQLPCRPR